MNKIYILWWRYGDGSAMGVERAYISKERAELDLKLLEEAYCSKNYEIKELEVTN